jgi:hypothetical protein
MRAKIDMKHGKTRAELTPSDRNLLGRAVELLVNLRVCEQVDAEVVAAADIAEDNLANVLAAYPAECDESKAKTPKDEK